MVDPILITGCARSGTSLTAGIINICGAFGGDLFGPNQHNQKGMFENKEIRQNMVKPYLKRIGCDPLGQKPLPNNRQVFEVTAQQAREWGNRVQLIFQHQGYTDGPWFYKGAKMCLVWYLWSQAFPSAKWVIVRRNPGDIVRSCERTRFMKAYRDRDGWMEWIRIHEQRFDQMKQAGLDVLEFWPSRVIEGNLEPAREMVEWLGLEWRDSMVRAFIDPSLYHNRRN